MKRVPPAEGQEFVWDYPRPPRVEPSSEHVVVRLGGVVVAETRTSFRVLETSHPPVYYLPRSAFADGALEPAPGRSVCEFKGAASYVSVRGGGATAESAGWTYPDPMAGFEELQDTVAVYPGRMDSCTVDGETVQPQPGDFYGGWITSRVVGPFKGAPGTMFW
ncbi:DUF427 domain-containing protein [Rathayibacter sp. VKM Ac-2630]|uniref:DUF427 domain-containing protein n=1 Tax=Rathayibacter sp. VKM Ac-2630 TaxID=1938617 RepID=UPI0009813944|nr:DUF427 domain-containing protein [Rathayibacter sp. VKM Ac-2630]OOB90672.1 hypothetical protein B0T42_10285 [Rathayibacter sp. VKM Ac-2630]